LAGTRAIASARIAARRRSLCKPVGGATVRSARSSISRAPFSCLAGFVEPGETIEEAVRREVLEEVGIACGRITYFTSQPWPFPMSLMIGCYAQALTDKIVVDRTELEDARWFEREELALMLLRKHPGGLTATLPHAIAHHIIRRYIEEGADVLG
jgi:NAD+ diphosphatase